MNCFDEDHLKRDSIVSSSSSLSNDSNDSQLSIIFHRSKLDSDSFGYKIENNPKEISLNEQSKEKISYSGQVLFFGPLILCLILLISGIIVFIIVEQRNNKHQNKEIKFNYRLNLTPDDNFMPILCPFKEQTRFIETDFAFNEFQCGRRRSSVINIYYSNNRRPINPGENLTLEDVVNPPIIQLNYEFLSKVNTKSFVLILIDPVWLPNYIHKIILHWIRYFSSSLEDEEDICSYKLIDHVHLRTLEKLILLYATNSSQMMIRAKTICNQLIDPFQLIHYVNFNKLKLISSTNFFIPYVQRSDE